MCGLEPVTEYPGAPSSVDWGYHLPWGLVWRLSTQHSKLRTHFETSFVAQALHVVVPPPCALSAWFCPQSCVHRAVDKTTTRNRGLQQLLPWAREDTAVLRTGSQRHSSPSHPASTGIDQTTKPRNMTFFCFGKNSHSKTRFK